MQTRPDRYFVRLDAPPKASAVAPPIQPPRYEEPSHPHRRRRRRVRIRPLTIFLLAILVGLAWLQTQPGGVSGQVNKWIDKIKGDVQSAANTDLRRASDYFNSLYQRQGAYPKLTDEQLREDPNAGFGIGVNTRWCSPRDMVLTGMTGGGTVSRLLLDGKDLGQESGDLGCPADLDHPKPWKN